MSTRKSRGPEAPCAPSRREAPIVGVSVGVVYEEESVGPLDLTLSRELRDDRGRLAGHGSLGLHAVAVRADGALLGETFYLSPRRPARVRADPRPSPLQVARLAIPPEILQPRRSALDHHAIGQIASEPVAELVLGDDDEAASHGCATQSSPSAVHSSPVVSTSSMAILGCSLIRLAATEPSAPRASITT